LCDRLAEPGSRFLAAAEVRRLVSGYEGAMLSENVPVTSADEDEAADDAALEDDGTEDLTEDGRDIVDD
jgi:hypothetical protein